MVYIMNNDYLRHYGILGMKWVSDYQNKDGTLTEAGKKRGLIGVVNVSYLTARDAIKKKKEKKNKEAEQGGKTN